MDSSPTTVKQNSVPPPAPAPSVPAHGASAAAKERGPAKRLRAPRDRKVSKAGTNPTAADQSKAEKAPRRLRGDLAAARRGRVPKAPGAPVDPFVLPDRTTLAAMVAYIAAFVALVVWGLELRGPDGVSPWFPAVGLIVAAVALGGARWIPAVLVGSLLGGLVNVTHTEIATTVAAAFAMTAAYGGTGLVLRRMMDPNRPLTRVTDAWWFIGLAVVAAPIAVALLTIGSFYATGSAPASWNFFDVVRTFVLGDSLGMVSVAPACIVAITGFRRYGARGVLPSRDFLQPEPLAALFVLVSATPAIYLAGSADLRAVAALPLVWLALRFGISGAVIGSFVWASTSAVVLASTSDDAAFAGVQAFLLTGIMLAVIVGAVVSERGRTQRELRHLAMHDLPSGLPNEPHLIELLDQALVEARGREVTTLIVRFAGLRQVAAALSKKDTQQLVASLSQKIAAIAGPTALIARPGFDRFAVLITGADQTRRQAIADELIEVLHQPLAVESREVFVDPRVGITVGLPGEAADVVLAHAVHASDVAAVAEGHRIGYYDATLERAQRDRQELTEDLRIATERGEFLLAFQPIVTAKEGTVVAAEALLRWVDQKRGNVPPMDFIPVAEETGLILPIGRWVLNEACRRATQWPHVAGHPIDVSVNVSPIQLMDEGFVDDVAEALRFSGLPASRLRVEITEGIVLEDIERTILRIHQLREMGVETMLDDFGTGHSSLAWVQRLPVSCIKIDRAFVNDVAVDGIDRAIVHASLYLSRALGTETVAEGVETEAQREQLIRMGCQKLQGYLFARPQPADVFPDWLAKQRARARATPGHPAVTQVPAARPAMPAQTPTHAQVAAMAQAAAPVQYELSTAHPAQAPVAPQPMYPPAAPAQRPASPPAAPAQHIAQAPHGAYAAAPQAPAQPAHHAAYGQVPQQAPGYGGQVAQQAPAYAPQQPDRGGLATVPDPRSAA